MREGWSCKIAVLFWMVLLAAISGSVCAQKYNLEFKAGITANRAVNSLVGQKSIQECKFGPSVGAGFGYNFLDGSLRACGEAYFSAKGEHYRMDPRHDIFDSEVNYFQISPAVRYYIPYAPVYVGAGMYVGYATLRNVTHGDTLDQSHNWKRLEYYKAMDYGTRLSLGMELGVQSVRVLVELAWEYGLADISDRQVRDVRNQSVSLSLGLGFRIYGRRYKGY